MNEPNQDNSGELGRLQRQLQELTAKLELLSKPYEDAVADRVIKRVSNHFMTLGKAVAAIAFAILAYFGFQTYKDVGSKAREFIDTEMKKQISENIRTQLGSEIQKASDQMGTELQKSKTQFEAKLHEYQQQIETSTTTMEGRIVQAIDTQSAAVQARLEAAAKERLDVTIKEIGKKINDQALAKNVESEISRNSLLQGAGKGFVQFGVLINGSSWSVRNFAAGPSPYSSLPERGQEAIAATDVNLRDRPVQSGSSDTEKIFGTIIGVIPSGTKVRILSCDKIPTQGGYYYWAEVENISPDSGSSS